MNDKVALVTGAAQGIGHAIASTFVAHGARVVVADMDGERLEAAEGSHAGGNHGLDVRDDGDVGLHRDHGVGPAKLLHGLLELVAVHVGNDNPGAVRDEGRGDGMADTLRGPGHERHLVVHRWGSSQSAIAARVPSSMASKNFRDPSTSPTR